MTAAKLAFVILLSTVSPWAQRIPAGTALPVTLDSTLDARKVKTDQTISATVRQDVPLSPAPMLEDGTKIPARSHVYGRVLDVGKKADGGSYIRIAFSRVRAKGVDIPVVTSLRALAFWLDVRDAQLPTHVPYRGEGPYNWNTLQIGGDVVYRGGGHVMAGDQVVGVPVANVGVLAELTPVNKPGCEAGSEHRRLALWVFSSSACGAYGFGGEVEVGHAGDREPVGEIVLHSPGNVNVHSGSALLLITTEAPQ